MAKPKFSFKIDWYTFKKQGIPSSAKLQPALERNLTKLALSTMVDIVHQFNADKANGQPTYRLPHLLTPGVLTCSCCGCQPCLDDYLMDEYGTHQYI